LIRRRLERLLSPLTIGITALLGLPGCGPTAAGDAPSSTPAVEARADELALSWNHDPRPCQHYASFDVPGGTNTAAFGLNDLGQIVGRWTTSDGVVKGFLRQPSGRFDTLEFPGATFTAPVHLNNPGSVVGRYLDPERVSHGFVLLHGRYQTIDAPGAVDTRARGIDDRGRITGNFTREDGVEHGFILDHDRFTQIDFPNSASTDVWDINTLGVAVGDWSDADRVHGYVLKQGVFTSFDFPGQPIATSARQLNLFGAIVGVVAFDDEVDHGFLKLGDHYRQLDFPGSAGTDAFGINLWGLIVGGWNDADGASHGFALSDCSAADR